MKKMFDTVDKTVFTMASLVTLAFIVWIGFFTESANIVVNVVLGMVMKNFGWVYLLVSLGIFSFCMFLCFSRYGKIKLGKDSDKPEFSTASWLAMMFSAAMGVGLIFFGVAEPMMLFANPPVGDPFTLEGAMMGLRACFFQNGMSGWASYCLFGITLAYFNYRKGLPALLSSTLQPIIGDRGVNGNLGKSADAFNIISTVFGVSAALAVCSTQLSAGFNFQFGMPISGTTNTIIIIAIVIMYLISATSGVNRGIKFISNANVWIATILLVYITIAGPTVWIFKTFLQTTGDYIANFVGMATYTDAFGTVEAHTGYDFVGSNPVMYIAWFMAWTGFVGAFIARVSRGRTIREVVWGVLLIPGIVSLFWFVAFGGTGIYLDIFKGTNLSPIVAKNAATALFILFEQLPMGSFFSLIATVLIFTFFITTADSATYVASVYSCRGSNDEPKFWVKLYWGIVIGVIAAVFLPIGGVQVSRQLCLIIAFPIMIIACLMVYSLTKELLREKSIKKEDIYKKVVNE